MPTPPAQPGVQGPASTGTGVTGFEALLAALTPGLADAASPRSEDHVPQPGDDETAATNLADPGLMGGFVLTSLFVPPPPVALPQGQAISIQVQTKATGPDAKAPAAPGPETGATAEPGVDPMAVDDMIDLAAPDLLASPVASAAAKAEPRPSPSRPAAAPPEASPAPTASAPQVQAPAQPASAPPPPTVVPAQAQTQTQTQAQAAGDPTEIAVASAAEPKGTNVEGPSGETPESVSDVSPDQTPLRPTARPQQGQDNPGSGSEGDRRQDTGSKGQATSQPTDVPAQTTRSDFAAQPHLTVAAHGPVADQVRAAPHTVAHMAEQIIRKVDGQTTRFDIQLDPLGLGQVDVRIEIGADGQLKAAMSFETQAAANELQARSGELKRALEDAGFNLGGGLSFEVSRDPNGPGRDLAQQNQQQHQAQQDSRGGGRAFQAAMDRADSPDEPVRAGEIYLQRRTQSGIDVRI